MTTLELMRGIVQEQNDIPSDPVTQFKVEDCPECNPDGFWWRHRLDHMDCPTCGREW